MRLRATAFATLAILSCGDPVAPGGIDDAIRELPTDLRFRASADGDLPDGRHITCSIDTYIMLGMEVSAAGSASIRTGNGGGDATRFKELSNGNTVEFWAHTYFEDIQVAYIGTDSIEVRSPQSATATERFWKEFTRFPGNRRSQDPAQGIFAHGTWTCHPMDTPESSGEYFDNEGSIAGTWTLERAPAHASHLHIRKR